jgi:hypothetical protein
LGDEDVVELGEFRFGFRGAHRRHHVPGVVVEELCGRPTDAGRAAGDENCLCRLRCSFLRRRGLWSVLRDLEAASKSSDSPVARRTMHRYWRVWRSDGACSNHEPAPILFEFLLETHGPPRRFPQTDAGTI